jgi:hypothetical protein
MTKTLTKQDATIVRDHALKAIEELMALFHFVKDRCSTKQHEQFKRGVGMSIGRIQMDILEVINAAYPELDDLADSQNRPEI